jgi:aryl-alcohol dehydrogenase-like predicted oxidoreductase
MERMDVAMDYRTLGSQGPRISVIGYGGWEAGGTGWGVRTPNSEVLAALRHAFDCGLSWVDTAEIYGDGRSEQLIGQAISDRPDVLVFTKVASAPRGTGFGPGDVARAAEASLRRLHRGVIDLYQLHWMDERDAMLEDTWGAMARLVRDGSVRWIGVSNFTTEAIARCERIHHVDSLQPHLSMLWQERLPLLDFCSRNGTGVIPYGPLAFGLLTGSITPQTIFPDDDWRSGTHGLLAYDQLFAPGRLEPNLAVVDALRPVALRKGITLAQLSLAWVLHQPGITGAIAGSVSREHVREDAAAATVRLSAADLEEIDGVLQLRGEVSAPLGLHKEAGR